MSKYQENAMFTASLDGVKLSPEQIKRIDKGIKDVIMTELATIDHGGNLMINSRLDQNPRFRKIIWDGRTMGIWIEDYDKFLERTK